MALPGVGTSLVAYWKAGVGVTTSSGKITAFADQTSHAQNMVEYSAGIGPNYNAFQLDGIPLASNPLINGDGRALKIAAGIKNRSGTVFGYDTGEHQPRTFMAVLIPMFASAAFDITGGPVCGFGSTPKFQCLFDLEDTFGANKFFLLGENWRSDTDANRGPNTVGGAGGIYDGAPLIVFWRSSGFDDIRARVNGVNQTLTPTAMQGTTGTTIDPGFIWGQSGSGALHFMGAIGDTAVWDDDLSDVDVVLAELEMKARFPSLSPTPPASPIISPRRVISIPSGKVLFSAAGGVGDLTFSFAAGGNLSGASLDATTGEYQAGERSPAEDVVVVTDEAAGTDTAEVSVAGSLYRAYQSRTPAGPQGPNLRLTERTYGSEKDVQFERARQASLVGLLGAGPDGQVDGVGEDRLLPRAVSESPADLGGTNDEAFSERLRGMWTNEHGHRRAGGHEGLLRALDRAGFPTGDPDGLHVIQKTKLVSWLDAGVVTFADHSGWRFDWRGAEVWHEFGILFGADFTPPGGGIFQDGDPSADLLNALVRQWKVPKAKYMGAWVVISGPTWGWPLDAEWGDGGRVWGGGSTRFVSPG